MPVLTRLARPAGGNAWALPATLPLRGGMPTLLPASMWQMRSPWSVPLRRFRQTGPAALGWVICVTAAGCLVAACGNGGPAQTADTPPASPLASAAPAGPASPAATPSVRKILVIMEENHDVSAVFPSGMPYLWSLAQRYGYAANWNAIGHPSLPNYLAIFGGSAFNYPSDCSPGPGCDYPGPSVFGQALARGETARAYEESMPHPCDTSNSGNYDVNHNPWAYFPSEAAQCRAGDVPAGTTASGALASDVRAGKLPTVGMVTPNLSDDAHDGTLAQADAWLRGWLPVLMSGPDWRSGKLAIAIVFDEGVSTNRVPFVLLAPHVTRVVMHQPATHYALTRLIDQFIGARPLRHAAAAANITGRIGLAP
jgi:phosphatidylinositol-3-phosphatase